jgi:hypothetical protein
MAFAFKRTPDKVVTNALFDWDDAPPIATEKCPICGSPAREVSRATHTRWLLCIAGPCGEVSTNIPGSQWRK